MFASRTQENGVQGRLGVIVNPIAGMGGRVGLKGTDGAATLARARALGAEPLAESRAIRALRRLGDAGAILAAPGAMGETALRAAGLACETLPGASPAETSAVETRKAAARMQAAGVELILFAGGDGTARDLVAALGTRVPILGIPTGVKMHSAVFATTPEAAGEVAAQFLRAGGGLIEAEVMDLDEAALREGRVAARLFGTAMVPRARRGVQCRKGPAMPGDEDALEALARRLAREWPADRLLVFGCGTTTPCFANSSGVFVNGW